MFESGYLQVDDIHKIYYEQLGNPNGKPILFLHGGPGAGFSSFHKNFFDQERYRIIFFDQRGSGKSEPYAETRNNTTQLLIQDIEQIRNHFKIDKWILFGGSWGSTLALLYSIFFPEKCSALILRGVFLGTKKEIDWFLYEMYRFFPEAHKKFINSIPSKYHSDILNWYYKKIHSNVKSKSLKASASWNEYESSCSTLKYVERKNSGLESLAIAKIETHYFVNNCFIEDNFIINNIKKIIHIPAFIVQGRHDVICPPNTAMKLFYGLKNARIDIVEDAGHSAFETSIFKKIVKSLDEIYKMMI